MEFMKTAMELEIEAIKKYRDLAEQCSAHEGVRRILHMLIADHEEHLASLRTMQDEKGASRGEPETFSEIKQLLEKMRAQKDTFSCSMNQLHLYREARDLVLEKQELYKKIQSTLPDLPGRNRLEALIKEEGKQAQVLDNIIQMVERPEQWLEDAEFSHLDEY